MADDAKVHHLVDTRHRVGEFLLNDGEQMTKLGSFVGASHAKGPFSVLYLGVVGLQRSSLRIRLSLIVRQITHSRPVKHSI
jgi:hypothetical protein